MLAGWKALGAIRLAKALGLDMTKYDHVPIRDLWADLEAMGYVFKGRFWRKTEGAEPEK